MAPPSLPPPPAQLASLSPASSRRSSSGKVPPMFDGAALQGYLKSMLSSRLSTVSWSPAAAKTLGDRIAVDVKRRMQDLQPKAFKYIVIAQIVEARGQGGSSQMACLWDPECDTVAKEVYENESLICTVVCFALRASY